MKRKQIEKIPWNKVGDKGKKAGYIAVATTVEIETIPHLILDIYKRKQYQQPVMRAAYTETDWAIYYVEESRWYQRRLKDKNDILRWEVEDGSSTYISKSSEDIITQFVERENRNSWGTWDRKLSRIEDDILWEKRSQASGRRVERLQSRLEQSGEIPEAVTKWIEEELFRGEHYIFYKRKGNNTECYCATCGHSYTLKHNELVRCSDMIPEIPKKDERGQCLHCGTTGTFKASGYAKNGIRIIRPCYTAERYGEEDVVVRYIEPTKSFRKGQEEYINILEVSRIYYIGGKVLRDYNVYNGWSCQQEWQDCNIAGMNNIALMNGRVWPGSIKELKQTKFKYSEVDKFLLRYREINLSKYLEHYQNNPCMEFLSKMGMHKLVKAIYDNRLRFNDKREKKPNQLLGIKAEKMKFFSATAGDPDVYDVLRMEKEENYSWTNEQVMELARMNVNKEKFIKVMHYMGVQKFINRTHRYALGQIRDFKDKSTIYLDYLDMKENMGYDISDSVIQYPKDLAAAHRNVVNEFNTKVAEKRAQEKDKQYPEIKKKYRSLKAKYYYESGDYIIRPAKSAGEIVTEGRVLHHCVGGDGYLSGHNAGRAIILFLREKENPETPYITIEITGNVIKQWYGAYDKKPDKEKIGPWLEEYLEQLREHAVRIEIAS